MDEGAGEYLARTRRLGIAIQDRRRLFREGLALILSAEPDLCVVAHAMAAQDLMVATAGRDLDVVLLDLDSAEWDPCRLVAALRRRHAGLAVIGTVGGVDPRPSLQAYRAGVRAVIPRDAGVRTLLQTIRSAPGPGRSPELHQVVNLRDKSPVLSHREIEVLTGISSGGTAQRVALALGISPKTVENHKQRIFAKLGVQNQAHAVAVASRQGLLAPSAAGISSSFPPLSA